ncbi:MAG: LptF/LptG family permease [Spirochaetaceae bacterium]|jgi:lipopolysaccharide export system permease protein|nr:LptF/LptG family permease [Spirochaetaceae bacterium]
MVPSTLDRYLLRQLFPVLLVMTSFFVLLLVIIDLFSNIWRYLNNDVSVAQIIMVSIYYIPKCLSYAVPMALLFSVAYTIGEFYTRNELISVFASGIPFWRWTASLIVVGFLLSIAYFLFQDSVVVSSYRTKNDMSRTLLKQQRTESNSDIVVRTNNGRRIYSIDYFDTKADTLNELVIVNLDEQGNFEAMVRSPLGTWNGEQWILKNPIRYSWQGNLIRVNNMSEDEVIAADYSESPDTFRRSAINVQDLNLKDAKGLITDLKRAGLPFAEAQTDYYDRFAWAVTPLVVLLLSIPLGGRFRKNILLMSLLSSLVIVVVYYVLHMVTIMFAQLGYIGPIAGAWTPVIVFTALGAGLLVGAKT